MADIKRYLDNITAQHGGKPRFMAWLSANLSAIDDACEVARTLSDRFRLDEAQGPQLDVLGELVNIPRALPESFRNSENGILEDSAYRHMVRTKIVKNQWDGTQEGFPSIWTSALGDEVQAEYFDHQDMSMTATLTGDFEPQYTELILRGYVVPKPVGVRVKLALCTPAPNASTMSAGCTVYSTCVDYKVQT